MVPLGVPQVPEQWFPLGERGTPDQKYPWAFPWEKGLVSPRFALVRQELYTAQEAAEIGWGPWLATMFKRG